MRARYVIRITPEDIGSRVSVRAWREDAAEVDSGPRHDDAVGVLESWDDGMLGIRRRDGRLTLLDETLLVAGKVIPDAPLRQRRAPGPGQTAGPDPDR